VGEFREWRAEGIASGVTKRDKKRGTSISNQAGGKGPRWKGGGGIWVLGDELVKLIPCGSGSSNTVGEQNEGCRGRSFIWKRITGGPALKVGKKLLFRKKQTYASGGTVRNVRNRIGVQRGARSSYSREVLNERGGRCGGRGHCETSGFKTG